MIVMSHMFGIRIHSAVRVERHSLAKPTININLRPHVVVAMVQK